MRMSSWLAKAAVFSFFIFSASICLADPITVLVPSQPSIEPAPTPKKPENRQITNEVDLLISLMRPFAYKGEDMERPQLFAQIHYPGGTGEPKPERQDLLDDVEEIRYLDKKAWGANVALPNPGLYQFVLETRPWWNEEKAIFEQQQAKVILPVLGVENGWHLSTGQAFEILPLTRPFGLTAPAVFTGRVMVNGKPYDNAEIKMGRINADKLKVPTTWHETLVARTDAAGQFTFTLNQPGWWYCEARMESDPLKGQDGKPKILERSTIFWIYVDPPIFEKAKNENGKKQ